MKPTYIYRGKCLRVVDGDTVDLMIDAGFKLTVTARFRLAGINTPELKSADEAERARALEAKNFLTEKIMPAVVEVGQWPLTVQTMKDPDVYGRWLARILVGDEDVNQTLLDRGFASIYRR